LKTINEHDTMI